MKLLYTGQSKASINQDIKDISQDEFDSDERPRAFKNRKKKRNKKRNQTKIERNDA